MDGRRATTHWHWSDEFARRFPTVRVDSSMLYVDEGDVVTSAGTTAGLDCCLHLLRDAVGAELANRVARRLVVAPHREGGQAQYIEQALPDASDDDRIGATLSWALGQIARPHTLDGLAKRAHMSRRTFTRHFRQRTGTSVGPWLAAQRIAFAQRLLETSDHGIERIATEAGFGRALSLRQHFAHTLALSPSQYRRQFRR